MFKTFIAILVVSVITAQAFVRREAAAPTTESALDSAKNTFKDFSAKIQEAINPEQFKALLDRANEETKKMIDLITKKKEP